ncbi:hypothetical protein SD71_14880 [Cohnella kolymensis]|uniref:Uncharacterized protein n=1 Tax=Cohnella kolymensis TaxID=1590652 RepID=A0ABR5A2M2_9BACL|nr:hypothetical protein [Cohnella kolymensis]KIL35312.1 hypothetical protein SD71_14880 [Cohnella kolymensis]
MGPWLSLVLLGTAIAGYAWMMPRPTGGGKEPEFAAEAAYDRLLEDLENENRELVDAVAKFKREQDDTVQKLNRRVMEMEQQLKDLQQRSSDNAVIAIEKPAEPAAAKAAQPEANTAVQPASVIADEDTSAPLTLDEISLPPTTVRGRYPELMTLHDRGRSVDQIAKAMRLNKGEVQLILQLVRREEEQHA